MDFLISSAIIAVLVLACFGLYVFVNHMLDYNPNDIGKDSTQDLVDLLVVSMENFPDDWDATKAGIRNKKTGFGIQFSNSVKEIKVADMYPARRNQRALMNAAIKLFTLKTGQTMQLKE